ncbi:hypothetical protein Sjap_019323 [Stephania japonica]|uniref:Uncharacterized protein n=1 Tax=Stephania japonica TaxID=461633 RepID=A0AAP0F7G4_9MAGN
MQARMDKKLTQAQLAQQCDGMDGATNTPVTKTFVTPDEEEIFDEEPKKASANENLTCVFSFEALFITEFNRLVDEAPLPIDSPFRRQIKNPGELKTTPDLEKLAFGAPTEQRSEHSRGD